MASAEEWHQHHRNSTAKLGERTLQLSFGCIAVVWIFKEVSPTGAIMLALSLRLALTLAVLALLLDFLQYIVAALVRKHYADLADQNGLGSEAEVYAPLAVMRRLEWCLWGKIIAVFSSYIALGFFLVPRLFWIE